MDGEDRLSALGDDLLRRILHFVPSKEAASTSVLSRRWGSLWRSSGAVNLAARIDEAGDDDDIYGNAHILSCQEAFVRAAEAPVTRLTLDVDATAHVRGHDVITQFLHQRRGCWLTDADLVRRALSHHAARHVEELRVVLVEAFDAACFADREIDLSNKTSCSLASLPPSETLRVLELTRCDLTRLAPAALPRLATLRLRLCTVKHAPLVALLAAAPVLTAVHLETVLFAGHQFGDSESDDVRDGFTTPAPPVVRLRLSFPTVTTLVLARCGLDGGKDISWAVEVDAPRLRSFVYQGQIRRFVLSAAPDIERVDLHFLHGNTYRRRDDDDKETARVLFWQFLHSFAGARVLKLTVNRELKDIAAIGKARRAKLLCAFRNVERLDLEGAHNPGCKTAAVAIANLLHCCPVLGELTLKLSTVPHHSQKDRRHGSHLLERKYRLDYTKSVRRFMRRSRVSMEDTNGDHCDGRYEYDDVPDIPGLSRHSFACLQSSLRRVSLQFRLDDYGSSCLGVRLIKFFSHNAVVLEEMRVDTGNRRLYEHRRFRVERLAIVPHSGNVCFQHKDLAKSSRESTMLLPLQKRSRESTMLLPLQKRRRITTSLDPL